ncbi:putative Peptidylamidoglycolate lyase [Desulfamplus magnetovallimortis]|uniref:Putative Peptidylamidoglycolate lyase n=1 Tax=Desulfamplus magnetovallimortis TaxID=1246637 RepID=A0A1W1HAC6_9BACT|nr:6-bladed beta-propeller [Desulfamplus magnetovallimortis]SLM29355.1 putative Peptidylamidoglycolate lyase [Desulfamplus magnetovallimortis]
MKSRLFSNIPEKNDHGFYKKAIFIFMHFSILHFLLFSSFCLFQPSPLFASELYQYQSMFPSLQQPWYFQQPMSVVATGNGNLLVADTGNNRIVKFNPDGQMITTWGKYGHGDGEFDTPSAIAVDSNGNVYVLDCAFEKNRLIKFDQYGNFIFSRDRGESTDQGKFFFSSSHSNIAVSHDNIIYISDTNNNRIQKFTVDGSFLGYIDTLSGNCTSDCQLYFPSRMVFDSSGNLFVLHRNSFGKEKNIVVKLSSSDEYILSFEIESDIDSEVYSDDSSSIANLAGMAIDENDNLYISDATDHRILSYSSEGLYLGTIGSKGSGKGQFNAPYGLCFGKDGKLYVADRDNNRIEKFSREKLFVNSWSSNGTEPGMFNKPSGIAVDIAGNVFIADRKNHRVQKLDANGNVLMIIGEKGEENGKFNSPSNVDVDQTGNIYVADSWNNRIQKFDSQGNFIATWGNIYEHFGEGNGELKAPVGIAADSMDNLYVADFGNARIQKFTSDGLFVSQWGTACHDNGMDDICFYDIEDIAVDSSGNVYVSDSSDEFDNSNTYDHAHRIQKFSPDGELLATIGAYGSDDGQLNYPFGIDVDDNGNIYVADSRNYRIQKFSSSGEFLGTVGEFGAGPGQFMLPYDVATGKDGKLFVVDSFTNTVQVFDTFTYDDSTAPDTAPDASPSASDGSPVIKKKALIVAGGGPYTGNTLWDTTRSCANFAYRTLRHKGFAKKDIYYLCDDDGLDLDGNGIFDDIYAKPGNDIIESIITESALDADEFLIYFVDHGGDLTFSLDGTTNLVAESLDQWLDTYESGSSGKSTLVYDACQSGSFISKMTPDSTGSRTVITSAGQDEYAYFVSAGTISFSEYFWSSIFNGNNLATSFRQASGGITLLDLSQTPELDANGNSISNEDEDYTFCLALDSVFSGKNGQGTANSSSGDIPVIGDADTVTLVDKSGQAIIKASGVFDNDGIERVWATIIPPDYIPSDPDIPVTDLPEIELLPVLTDIDSTSGGSQDRATVYTSGSNQGSGTGYTSGSWQALYNGFTKSGIYRVTIYARDVKGNSAVPVTAAFVTDTESLPKALVVTTDSDNPSRTSIYKSLGDQAENALMVQGFSQDRIYSMHAPSYSDLTSAITSWASDTHDLIIFIVGDGTASGVNLNSSLQSGTQDEGVGENEENYDDDDGNDESQVDGENISPSALKSLLDQYQSLTGGNVNVVIDADFSGQFLKGVADSSEISGNLQRIIVSSTTETGKASFESQGLSSFSSYFWNSVLKGSNLWDAFLSSMNAVSYLSQSLVILGLSNEIQTPLIDDNGNGIGNEDYEGLNAKNQHIGLGIITGADHFATGNIEKSIILDGDISAMLAVDEINTTADVIKVWAVITPPVDSAMMQQNQEISETLSLPIVYLLPAGNGKYQWMYSGFDVAGTYYTDYYLLDSSGTVSFIGRSIISQTVVPESTSFQVVQGGDSLVTAYVDADELVTLNLMTYLEPEIRKNVVHEWLVLATGNLEGNISFYLFSPSGIASVPLSNGIFSDHAFPFDHFRNYTNFATLTLNSIGIASGEFLAYAYAYSLKEDVTDIFDLDVVFHNCVIVFAK